MCPAGGRLRGVRLLAEKVVVARLEIPALSRFGALAQRAAAC